MKSRFVSAGVAMVALLVSTLSMAAADAYEPHESRQFEFKIQGSDGSTQWTGAVVGTPTSFGNKKTVPSGCKFEVAEQTSSVGFGSSEGVLITLVPLEVTADGVRTLVSITRSDVDSPRTVTVTTGTPTSTTCAVVTGSFTEQTVREVRVLQIGVPTTFKLKDGKSYTVTAVKSK